MKDPYRVLGLAHDATEADVKRAYRRLAKRLHPDLNPGDARREEMFRELSAAYGILSDPETRRHWQRTASDKRKAAPLWPDADGESDRPFRYGDSTAGHRPRNEPAWDMAYGHGWGGTDDATATDPKAHGTPMFDSLRISFVEAAVGVTKPVMLADGRTAEVAIPPGTVDGQTLVIPGHQGRAAPPSDTFLEIRVDPHAEFRREGADIHLVFPVSLPEAVLGATVAVPTVYGDLAVTIPEGVNSGTVLRLAGKGVVDQATGQRGDQLVRLTVVLPDGPSPELADFLKTWAARHSYDARKKGGPARR